MDSCFFENGLNFECQRCSSCCRLSPGVVYLSQRDLTSLCEWFKISEQEFIDKYCRWVGYYGGLEALALQELKNYDCILWKAGTGCEAYGARPVQCSTFPFWTWVIENKESWEDMSKDCPGINKGKHWSKDEIGIQQIEYAHNKPITREPSII
ncbi:MAG: YkgJ family cysteine cluster protein [Treponema sp.]|nr:YkgJ family cysteine cluster protein [Treponema sp.]